MSNTETMQLDLFEGKILTNNQRLEIKQYVDRCDKEVLRKQNENWEIMLLLDKAGFKQGIDYIDNFKKFKETDNCEFGYSYNNTQWVAEVEIMRSSGGCFILHDNLRNGKIELSKSGVYRDGDKLQCTSITSQYRYYKPSSLLSKLKEHNASIQHQFEDNNKKQIIIEHTVEKYKKLYPEAEVSIGSSYHKRSYRDFKVVKVTFNSGSWVQFEMGWEKDKEFIHKKNDAKAETAREMLERFNNQKSK